MRRGRFRRRHLLRRASPRKDCTCIDKATGRVGDVACEVKFAFFFAVMTLLDAAPQRYKLAMSKDGEPGTMPAERPR
jgi:hypothetical protein